MVGGGCPCWDGVELYVATDATAASGQTRIRLRHSATTKLVRAFDWLAAWKATRVALARWAESRRRRPHPPLGVRPPAPPALWGSSLRAFTAC